MALRDRVKGLDNDLNDDDKARRIIRYLGGRQPCTGGPTQVQMLSAAGKLAAMAPEQVVKLDEYLVLILEDDGSYKDRAVMEVALRDRVKALVGFPDDAQALRVVRHLAGMRPCTREPNEQRLMRAAAALAELADDKVVALNANLALVLEADGSAKAVGASYDEGALAVLRAQMEREGMPNLAHRVIRVLGGVAHGGAPTAAQLEQIIVQIDAMGAAAAQETALRALQGHLDCVMDVTGAPLDAAVARVNMLARLQAVPAGAIDSANKARQLVCWLATPKMDPVQTYDADITIAQLTTVSVTLCTMDPAAVTRAWQYANAVYQNTGALKSRDNALIGLRAELREGARANLPSDDAANRIIRLMLEPAEAADFDLATLADPSERLLAVAEKLSGMTDAAITQLHTYVDLVLEDDGTFSSVGAFAGGDAWGQLRGHIAAIDPGGRGAIGDDAAHLLICHYGGVAPGDAPTSAQLLQAARALAELGATPPPDHATHVGRALACVKAVREMDGTPRAVGDGRGAGMWYQLRQAIRASGIPADAQAVSIDRVIYYLAEEAPVDKGVPDEATLVAAAYRLAEMEPADVLRIHADLAASEVKSGMGAIVEAAKDASWTCPQLFTAPPDEMVWLVAEVDRAKDDAAKFQVVRAAVDDRLRCRAGILDSKIREDVALGLSRRICQPGGQKLVSDWQTVLVDCNELTLAGMKAKPGHAHVARAPVTEWCYVGAEQGARDVTDAYARVIEILDRFHDEVATLPSIVVADTAAGGTNLALHTTLRDMETALEALKKTHKSCAVYVDQVLADCRSGDDAVFNETEVAVRRPTERWRYVKPKPVTRAMHGLTASIAQERIAAYRAGLQTVLSQQQADSKASQRYHEPNAGLGYAYGAFNVVTMLAVVKQAHPDLSALSQQALANYLAPDAGLPEYLPGRVTILSGILVWGDAVKPFTVAAITVDAIVPAFSFGEQSACTSIADYMAAAQAAAAARSVILEPAHLRQLMQAAVQAMYVSNEVEMDAQLKDCYESGKWPVCMAASPYGIGKDGSGENLYGEVLWDIACEQAAKKDWNKDKVAERRVIGQGFRVRPVATGASEARRMSLHATLQRSLTDSKQYAKFAVAAGERPGEYNVTLVRRDKGGSDRVCMCPVWQGRGRARVNRGYVSMRVRRGRSLSLAQARVIIRQAEISGLFVRGEKSPPIFAQDFDSFAHLYQAICEAKHVPTVRDEAPYCDWLEQLQAMERADASASAVDAADLKEWDAVERPTMKREIMADQREITILKTELAAAERELVALEAQLDGWLVTYKDEVVSGTAIENCAKDMAQFNTLPLHGSVKPLRSDVLAVLNTQVADSNVMDVESAYQHARACVMDLKLRQQKFEDRAASFQKSCPRVWESCAAEARRLAPGGGTASTGMVV